MDIVLERILSLIPKDPDGKYVHGAKTKFAKKIGYNDGAIVAMWENGSSISYNKKLYQIADQYHVSVKWLQGKTEDKSIKEAPATEGEGLSAARQKLYDAIANLTDEQCTKLLGVVEWAKENK